MEKLNKKRDEHFFNIEYIKNETKDIKDFWQKNKHRKIINQKYLFRFKVVSFFLASSQVFGIVLVNEMTKRINNTPIITIEEPKILEETVAPQFILHTKNKNNKGFIEINNKEEKISRDNISIENNFDNIEIIKKYSEIFEFDYEKIRDIVLPILEDDGLDINRDNRRIILEALIDIYFNTSNYGFTREELKSNVDFETNLSPEEQIIIFSDIFDICPYDALGIMTVEWGHPYNRNQDLNAIFGWNGTNNTPNKTVSMIISIAGLSNNYGFTREHNRDTIINMASTYCPPNTDFWKSVVLEVSENAMEYGIFYDYLEEDINDFVFNNKTYEEYRENDYSISPKANNRYMHL